MSSQVAGQGRQAVLPFEVETEVYRGPLDELMGLVRRRQVDLEDIDLAELSRQFLGYLAGVGEERLEDASFYLVMVVGLVALKLSGWLFPLPELPPAGEELMERLREVALVEEAVENLRRALGDERGIFTRGAAAAVPRRPGEELELEVSLPDLVEAYQGVLARARRKPAESPRLNISRDPRTVKQAAMELVALLSQGERLTLAQLIRRGASLSHFITDFLALLSLVAEGRVRLRRKKGVLEVSLAREGA